MSKKGLCDTCISDDNCAFPRKFPVLQCEEFADYEPRSARAGQIRRKKHIKA